MHGCAGIVYVISNSYLSKKNIYKIGFTSGTAVSRAAEMNTYIPVKELEYFPVFSFSVNCPRIVEQMLHERFAAQRVIEMDKREWFSLSFSDLNNLPRSVEQLQPEQCACALNSKKRLAAVTRTAIQVKRKAIEREIVLPVTSVKLSYSEVCEKFGIDIDGDKRNAFFWNMTMDKKLKVTEDLLSWCGYSGEYKTMKTNFLSLVKKNPQITYDEIKDSVVTKKRYVVLDPLDFESLLMQMRSPKAAEVRELYSYLKHISVQYMKYEKKFESLAGSQSSIEASAGSQSSIETSNDPQL